MGNSFATALLILVSLSGGLFASTTIPEVRSVSEYRDEFTSSVFLKNIFKTQTIAPENISNFGRGYVLDGVVVDSVRGVIAFVRDPERGVIVADSREGSELQIVDAVLSDLPQQTEITVTNGIDRVTLKYREIKAAAQNRAFETSHKNGLGGSRTSLHPSQRSNLNRSNGAVIEKGDDEEDWNLDRRQARAREMQGRAARDRIEEGMKREAGVGPKWEEERDEEKRIEEMREGEARSRLEVARKRESGDSFEGGAQNTPRNKAPAAPKKRVVLPIVEEE